MASLYRTYRPKAFADVVGQGHVVETLKQALAQDKVSHAYLFQGPRGTGKTTLARLLAMRVNCQTPAGAEPCGTCPSCTSLLAGSSLDIVEIDAASNRGIDDIRLLRETVATSPAGGKRKVYIIDEVHMLTNEAFAALLKTLEEPAAHAIFILATTELHKVPETIISRCQVFRFRRASEEEMRTRLAYILEHEKQALPEDVITFIVGRSDGCFRDAESLLGQILTLIPPGKGNTEGSTFLTQTLELLGIPAPDIITSFLSALENHDTTNAIAIIEKSYEQGFDPELIVEESIRTAREQALSRTKEGKGAGGLPAIIRALIQAKQDLAYVPQPLIALELAILSVVPPDKGSNGGLAAPQVRSAAPTLPVIARSVSDEAISSRTAAPTPRVIARSVSDEAISSEVYVPLEKLQSSWPQIIDFVKKQNPAASTFLRAMEPLAIESNTVIIRAQFGLHRNFFEKEANKELLAKALEHVLKMPVSARIQLDGQQPVAIANGRQAKENELLQNVKEIFG